ncbi:MAG: glycosyltransferase family 2 protein [Gemmatimonadetes bacterium]|nr:glycosyltransferase family 2 protein [Gemmatimonadota bacterium]
MARPLEKPAISFFFPACNEEKTVEELALRADKVLREVASDYEVIIVDDGSTDRTGEIADRLASEHRRIRVVHHEQNRGYGSALRTGFKEAKLDFIFYTDGDLQFDIAEMPKLIPLIEDADIVSAYKIKRMDTWERKIVSWVYNTSLRVFFDLPFKDVNCGFKLYRREVFDRIELKSTRGLIDAEVLLKARKAGFRIVQVGVTHFRRREGGSRYRVKEIAMTIAQMFDLWKDLRRN